MIITLELLAHYSISLPPTEWCHQGNQPMVGCQQPALGPVEILSSSGALLVPCKQLLSWTAWQASSRWQELWSPIAHRCCQTPRLSDRSTPARGSLFQEYDPNNSGRTSIYSHADVWDEKVNSVTEGVAARTGRVAHLECLLLKECQRIRKDIQSLYSLPIGCVQVSLDGQVLVAETRKMHRCCQFWRHQKSTTSFWK